ncbi:MAG: alpha/beta hydrolase [Chitinophagia bacterium]|nr:alpha/beta hydrolase [Chitinophagia bacterium]
MPQLTAKHFTTAQGDPIAYNIGGSGKAIVLLHGFPFSAAVWHTITDILTQHYTVITIDLPGFGNSVFTRQLNFTDTAHIINAVLDSENIPTAIVAGHSMGGYASLGFAQEYPERVAGISLITSTAEADDAAKKAVRTQSVDIILNGGKDLFITALIKKLFTAEYATANLPIIEEWIARGKEVKEEVLACYYVAMRDRPSSMEWLNQTSIPIQWMAGDQDPLLPLAGIFTQSAIPATAFINRYEHAAHGIMFEQPVQLSADLMNFANYCFELHPC